MLVYSTSWSAKDHNARAGSGNVFDLVVGGICQHFAVAVAVGVTDDRLSSEFPDLVAATNMLHTDRVDLTKIKSSIDLSVGDLSDVTLGVYDRGCGCFYVIYFCYDA